MRIQGDIIRRSSLNSPDWGIISMNTGTLETKGKLPDEIYDIDVIADAKVEISLNSSEYGMHKVLGTYSIEQSSYDIYQDKTTITLITRLTDWQNVVIPDFPVNIQMPRVTALAFVEYLQSKTPSNYEYVPIDIDLRQYLSSIQLLYHIISGNLWEQWQKLCDIIGVYVYLDADSKVVISREIE